MHPDTEPSEPRTDREIALESIEEARATKARDLDLSLSNIVEVPETIELLADHLRTLDLMGCGEFSNLKSVAKLTALESLDLSYCSQLTNIEPIANLTALQTLNLWYCDQITNIEPIANLTALQKLDLSFCDQLTNIEPIANLTALEKLYLQGVPLDVSSASWLFKEDSRLQTLIADTLLGAPAELASVGYRDNCLPRLRAWHRDLAAGQAPVSDVKVFLLGNGRVGKTQICNWLCGRPYNHAEDSTHGVQLNSFELAPGASHRPPLTARLWDFGGQDIYLGTHSLFLDERAVYIIAWSPAVEPAPANGAEFADDGDKSLQYWLDYVRSVAGDQAPVLVVQTRCDRVSDEQPAPFAPDHTFGRLRVTACSAREGDMERLLGELRTAARYLQERYEAVPIPSSWLAVRDVLRERESERTLELEDFNRLCTETHGATLPAAVLLYLHRSGEVFWRQDAFDGKVILDQAWALQGLYTLVQREDVLPLLRLEEGRFTRELLAGLVWDEDGFTLEEQHMFLRMMEQCGACFETGEDEYLALDCLPSALKTSGRRNQIWRGATPDASAVLRYDFLHRGVLHGMLCAVGGRVLKEAVYWRYGLCYYDVAASTVVKIEAVPGPVGTGEITVQAAGPQSSHVVEYLVQSVQRSISLGRPPQVAWTNCGPNSKSAPMPPGSGEESNEEPFSQVRAGLPPGVAAPVAAPLPTGGLPTRFLVMATEWFPAHGGLSAFNRQLCKALAEIGCEVVCVAPHFSDDERKDAATQPQVTLMASRALGTEDLTAHLSRKLTIPGFEPEVIVGHGRITGPGALAQKDNFSPKAKRVHFFHMSPEEIEWYKNKPDPAADAEQRRQLEFKLMKEADLVVPVGPTLTMEVEALLAPLPAPPPTLPFIPGFKAPQTRRVIESLRCLMLGRAEDYELKGLDIAAAAVAEACDNFRRKGRKEIILLVRGAPEHTSGELMSQLKSHCDGRDLDIRIRPFDPAQNIIEGDLMEASLLLMPSRTEGFGLVALEAISMGTPVLVSDQSGIGKWLSEWMKREMSDLPPVVVATSDDRASSVSTWAPAIERVLQDPALSLERARMLAARLAKAYTWQSAAELLRKALRSAN